MQKFNKNQEDLLLNLKNETMEDRFVVVTWPEIQNLMVFEDFNENACLINDQPFLDEYGSSAYFVRESWFNEIEK